MRKRISALWRFILHCAETDIIGVAAKTSFFLLLSIFPLCMFASWALGHFNLNLSVLEGFLPRDMIDVIPDMGKIPISNPVLFITALWAASSAVWALMKGVGMRAENIWQSLRARLMALVFTLCFLSVIILTLAFLAISRWLNLFFIAGATTLLLFALYCYTPGTSIPPKRAAWTSLAVSAVWLAISRIFELYMRYLSKYEALYGSFGIFLGLALWVFAICFVIGLGARIAERETAVP